jgi:hypothetical protein
MWRSAGYAGQRPRDLTDLSHEAQIRGHHGKTPAVTPFLRAGRAHTAKVIGLEIRINVQFHDSYGHGGMPKKRNEMRRSSAQLKLR